MEFGDDPRLKRLLQEWRVPDAPDALEPRVMGRTERSNGVLRWGRSLLRSHIRVPLPVALAVSVALMWLVFLVARDPMPTPQPLDAVDDLRGFQPVNSVNVRIERSSDATQ